MSRIVLFLSSGCSPCTKLRTSLIAPENAPKLPNDVKLIVVTDEWGAGKYSTPPFHGCIVDTNTQISKGFGITSVPYGIALDSEGVVRATATPNSIEDVASLAAALESPTVLAG